MDRDSMGSLAPREPSSEITTYEPALNVKALGADFVRLADSEAVNRALFRLMAVYGDPWGRDTAAAKQMAAEWEAALSDLPAKTIEHAITRWMRQATKWPKPADIRKLAETQVESRVADVSDATGMHPRRLQPSDEMAGFVYRKSMLRLNPTWAKFLDSLHPTAEHCFFARATMGEYANEVRHLTKYEADTIHDKWGEKLAEMFGKPVHLGNFHMPEPPVNERHQRSVEEIAERIAKLKRWHADVGTEMP